MSATTAELEALIEGAFAPDPPTRLGVAVSGGGDSVALMHLLAAWAKKTGVVLKVATVNHGLRKEAADEAKFVAQVAQQLGLAHETLTWQGWQGDGNLQDAARQARYRLLADWAVREELAAVAVAHTRDDQAETVLLQLARMAGVDGLAAMPARKWQHGMWFQRPLLRAGRADLRDYLRAIGQRWIEDPSNEDRSFDRIKARDALAVLSELGIDAATLAGVAANMAKAREALDWHAFLSAKEVVRIDRGDVVIDRKGWRALNDEIARRILKRALLWVGRAPYPPRQAKLAQLIGALKRGQGQTLGGCLVVVEETQIRICREALALRGIRLPQHAIWDGRWRVIGPVEEGAELAALGEAGLLACPEWRASGLPAASLKSSPAIWRKDELVAAPLAGFNPLWRAELLGGSESFFAGMLPQAK